MALADLLQAIEADAAAERARAAREAAAEATAIVEQARSQAAALAAELAAEPEGEARAQAERTRALARMDASAAVRSAREEAFASLLAGIRAELAALRGTAYYPELFRSLLAESRAALPEAHELRVDPRDLDLAMELAGELRVDAALGTWGGLELAGDDGRTIRNTLEERLANAEPLLRRRFARRLARAVHAGVR
jgi:V/A-type H+/Na+-transporting ATPase subunit E